MTLLLPSPCVRALSWRFAIATRKQECWGGLWLLEQIRLRLHHGLCLPDANPWRLCPQHADMLWEASLQVAAARTRRSVDSSRLAKGSAPSRGRGASQASTDCRIDTRPPRLRNQRFWQATVVGRRPILALPWPRAPMEHRTGECDRKGWPAASRRTRPRGVDLSCPHEFVAECPASTPRRVPA